MIAGSLAWSLADDWEWSESHFPFHCMQTYTKQILRSGAEKT